MNLPRFDPLNRLTSSDQTRILKLKKANRSGLSEGFEILGLDPGKDFQNMNLRNVDFLHSDLSKFDFAGSDISGADFSKCTGMHPMQFRECIINENTQMNEALREQILTQIPRAHLKDFVELRHSFDAELISKLRSSYIRAAKKSFKDNLSRWNNQFVRNELNRHYEPFWSFHKVNLHKEFAYCFRRVGKNKLKVSCAFSEVRNAIHICIVAGDHPDTFARICGAVDLADIAVSEVCTTTTKDGWLASSFWSKYVDGAKPSKNQLRDLKTTIRNRLRERIVGQRHHFRTGKEKKRSSPTELKPVVHFDNFRDDVYSIIQIDSHELPSVVYKITSTLAENNVYIANARTRSEGRLFVSDFFVKDMFGLKYHSESKQKTLRKRIIHALTND